MNKLPNYLDSPSAKLVAVISFALVCAGFASNANAENRLMQKKALSEAISKLQAYNLKLASDATLRASTEGFLMELSARVEHLGDLEELMSIAESGTQELLKSKVDKLRRYDFGYGCTITVNNIDAYVSAAHDGNLAAGLKDSKSVVAAICATAGIR
jgi:mevalonate pyrophosphate decarboxylase